MINNEVSPQKKYYFFFFINTKSGNGQGKTYMSSNFSQFKFKYQSNRNAFVYLCDLFQKQEKIKKLNLVKQCVEKQQKNIRIVITGGDGTILWVVNQILNIGVDPNKVVFVINPIGTGNDFARSLGWGADLLIKTGSLFKQQLAKQVLIWVNSQIVNYDLWDVQIQTYSNGQIYDIKNQVQIKRQQNKIQKIFSNYFGMGLDARVVYTVQRKRTKNAFINKIIYGLVGLCNFFKSLKKLDQLSFVSQNIFNLSEKSDLSTLQRQTDRALNQTDVSDIQQMIANNQSSLKLQKLKNQVKETTYKLKKGYRGVVCLNCTSYMCGLRQVWETKKIAEKNSHLSRFKAQKFDDGQVQFIAYKNQLDLALERIMRSGAKLAQGGGPFRLQLPVAKKQQQKNNYIQIDGQSIKVVNLKSVKIQKTTKIKGSQLKILFNNLLIKQ